MKLYRISNWSKIFENNRSRSIEKLTWVAIPNHHDGENFAAIMQHPDGAIIYAAWMLIVQVASRCRPRGVLVRPDGTPLTPESLNLKTRAPASWFATALQYIETQTDWMEVEDYMAGERQPGVSQASVERQEGAPRVRARMGGNGKEGKGWEVATANGSEKPDHAPTWDWVATWLAETTALGSDYQLPEARAAFLALNANGWMWGNRPVADWRSAIESRIQDARTKSQDRRQGFSDSSAPKTYI